MSAHYIVDAAFDRTRQVAAVAVVSPGSFIAADIVRCLNVNDAELLAIARALQIAGARSQHDGVVWTDSEFAARVLAAAEPRGLAQPIAKLVSRRRFSVQRRHRSDTTNAHTAARQTLKAWRAGRARETTWDHLAQSGLVKT